MTNVIIELVALPASATVYFNSCSLFQDKAELGCLRAIVLFNPDAKGLEQGPSTQVESFREKVYATLEEYTRLNHENEPSRYCYAKWYTAASTTHYCFHSLCYTCNRHIQNSFSHFPDLLSLLTHHGPGCYWLTQIWNQCNDVFNDVSDSPNSCCVFPPCARLV